MQRTTAFLSFLLDLHLRGTVAAKMQFSFYICYLDCADDQNDWIYWIINKVEKFHLLTDMFTYIMGLDITQAPVSLLLTGLISLLNICKTKVLREKKSVSLKKEKSAKVAMIQWKERWSLKTIKIHSMRVRDVLKA